jgi:acyl-CoA thioesterase-1
MMRLVAALLGLIILPVGCSHRDQERWLPRDSTAPILYVALGDSTAQGIGASQPEAGYVSRLHQRLRELYPAARLNNLSANGATSADVLGEQLPQALALRPHLVTLSVGPNDLTSGVSVDQFQDNVDRILTALRETGAVVVINLLPDLAVTPRFRTSRWRDAVERTTAEYNRALEAVARRNGAQLVDLYLPSHQEVPRRPDLISADGYHPSDAGHGRWAELMWAGIRARIPRDVRAARESVGRDGDRSSEAGALELRQPPIGIGV